MGRNERMPISIGILLVTMLGTHVASANANISTAVRSAQKQSAKQSVIIQSVNIQSVRIQSVNKQSVNIEVDSNGWGDAQPDDVLAVANSVVTTIRTSVQQIPNLKVLLHNGSEPITAFHSNAADPFNVTVSVDGTQWARLAYQFAHEFCHVLTLNRRQVATPADWFEESVCEAVSLLTLEGMALTWKTSPPYPNWKSYASSLADYATEVKQRPARKLPKNVTFAQWMSCTAADRSADPYNRNQNGVIANQMLPQLRKSSGVLPLLPLLNRGELTPDRSFEQLVLQWQHEAAPKSRSKITSFVKPLLQTKPCPR
jgi:hypothetical protein